MQIAINAAMITLILVLVSPLSAQDIRTGIDAYLRGDYAVAVKNLRPYAEGPRDKIAELMTPADLSEAQRLAREWQSN
jgi:hypothetical protein